MSQDNLDNAVDPINMLDIAHSLVEHYGLEDFYNAALTGTHIWNPYHNLDHEMLVMAHAYSLVRPYTTDEKILKAFLVACLFHDHNHTGKGPDNVNIDRALEFLKTPYMTKLIDEQLFPGAFDGIIEPTIRCTVFLDSKFPVAPANLYEKAIRDADLMMVYTEAGRDILTGLFKEMNGKYLFEIPGADARQHAAKNYLFLKDAKMYTKEGQTIKDRYLEPCFEAFRAKYAVHGPATPIASRAKAVPANTK